MSGAMRESSRHFPKKKKEAHSREKKISQANGEKNGKGEL